MCVSQDSLGLDCGRKVLPHKFEIPKSCSTIIQFHTILYTQTGRAGLANWQYVILDRCLHVQLFQCSRDLCYRFTLWNYSPHTVAIRRLFSFLFMVSFHEASNQLSFSRNYAHAIFTRCQNIYKPSQNKHHSTKRKKQKTK